MDSRIIKILKNICLFLFTGNIFVHAVIGASMTNGFIKGGASMAVTLMCIIVIARHGQKKDIEKSRKERQKKDMKKTA